MRPDDCVCQQKYFTRFAQYRHGRDLCSTRGALQAVLCLKIQALYLMRYLQSCWAGVFAWPRTWKVAA